MTITVKIPQKISLNKIYAGIHFRERASHKDDYYWSVAEAKPERYPGPFPVACHYHFKLAGSRLDIMNHAYMAKMVEDALVACDVLPDDTQKYIDRIIMTAEQIPKDQYDEVIVEISPSYPQP